MDLVDIDQVLDNLELREAADEHNKAAGARFSVVSAATNKEISTINNGASSRLTIRTPIHSSTTSNSSNTNSNSSTSYSKSFVGVSQVFNSLDDYRKNVQTLETAPVRQYDDECKLISNIDKPGANKETAKSKTIAIEESLDHVKQLEHASSSRNSSVKNDRTFQPEELEEDTNDEDVKDADADEDGVDGDVVDDVSDDDDDDDDDDLSNDIRQFKEDGEKKPKNYGDNEIDDLTTTTSDSLTTSSSSTFSSGPSPGVFTSTEEHSTPLSDDEVEGAIGNTALSEKILNPTTKDHLCQSTTNDEVIAKLQHYEGEEVVTEITSNKTTGLDDLAVGLSSISINSQSDLPREMTASSALGGVLNELSVTTGTSLLSHMRDNSLSYHQPTELVTETKSSLVTSSLSFPDCDSMKKQENHSINDVKIDKRAVNFVDMKASTNDPYLGKFPAPVTFGSTMDEISDTELDSMLQEMDIDDAEESHKATPVGTKINDETDAVIKAQHKSIAIQDEIEDTGASIDHMNADSFSQASTVEFSELKGTQTPAVDINETGSQSINSISSSYSSSESSLEDDIQPNGSSRKGSTNTRRPKRPTSLDLPALKVNLYANAGQTPPGQNLTHSDAELESCEEPVNPKEFNEFSKDQLPAEVVGNVSYNNHIQEQQHTELNEEGCISLNEHITANIDGADENEAAGGQDIAEATTYSDPHANLGKVPPIWVPDHMATACMQCHVKFTMIKRRHHCRACGKVLCSVCCSQKFKLDFLSNPESRVCVQCFLILMQRQQQLEENSSILPSEGDGAIGGSEVPVDVMNTVVTRATRSPNPNNPMEYCSTIPPHRQVTNSAVSPPTVIVPVGVLKKEGSNSSNSSNSSHVKTRKRKSVMFSDGIAPGSDLASMENDWSEAKHARRQHQADKQRSNKTQQTTTARTESALDASTMGLVAQLFRGSIPSIAASAAVSAAQGVSSNAAGESKSATPQSNPVSKTALNAGIRAKRLPPSGCDERGCFIPNGDNSLPPIYVTKGENSSEFDYKEVLNNFELAERLQREQLKFAVQQNFFVYVKIVNLKCCMNKTVINFTTSGMHHVGNDEIIILLEYEPAKNKSEMREPPIPKDIFVHLNEIYTEAEKCNPIAELSFTMPQQTNFLGSREYGGFLYIRATFQCLQDVIIPESPYLIGVLIHRNEVPWAKVFPLRLMLRLGAQYRYYPCPHISIRNRESVYADIAQTIINFLADFRNYSYTLPCIKGMYIHMEDRQTSVLIPRNRYDDVIKAINKSSDHILAFGGNFSKTADGHLVCIQNTKDTSAERNSYSTQAINIQGQPRKVTGASFFVLNEALKSSSGLSGKCSIVEDGLMVQIMPSKMEEVRNALKNTKDIDIVCGPIDADEQQTEVVSIKWVENDRDFGIGVKSPIDSMCLEGIPGMRVHASFNYSNANYSIRLTEIFMIKCDDWNGRIQAQDITRISEQIARSTSVALLPFLDLLVANGNLKIGLRVTLHQDNVCYEAGTRNSKLPPLYMNALDNSLISTLHTESTGIEDAIVLELIFYILNV